MPKWFYGYLGGGPSRLALRLAKTSCEQRRCCACIVGHGSVGSSLGVMFVAARKCASMLDGAPQEKYIGGYFLTEGPAPLSAADGPKHLKSKISFSSISIMLAMLPQR